MSELEFNGRLAKWEKKIMHAYIIKGDAPPILQSIYQSWRVEQSESVCCIKSSVALEELCQVTSTRYLNVGLETNI